MLLYSLPAFSKGDPTAFLSGVARANQLVKKVLSLSFCACWIRIAKHTHSMVHLTS